MPDLGAALDQLFSTDSDTLGAAIRVRVSARTRARLQDVTERLDCSDSDFIRAAISDALDRVEAHVDV